MTEEEKAGEVKAGKHFRRSFEEEKAGKVVNIPFNPEAPHPDLIPDTEAMNNLPESRKGEQLWTLRKKVSAQLPAMELVQKKAYLRSDTRICPRHGEVRILGKHYRPKAITAVESLACGHTLLISRLVGGLRTSASDPRQPSSYLHRAWLFIFKDTLFCAR